MSFYDLFKNAKGNELKIVSELVNNHADESQQLDFKRIDSLDFLIKGKEGKGKKKAEFARDISAMANSSGGIIIYGLQEEKHIDPESGKKISPNKIINWGNGIKKEEFNRDTVIRIANQALQPAIPNLDVKMIDHPEDKDTYLIILLIPETFNGASMVVCEGCKEIQYRYYYRHTIENLPMNDNLVRLVNSKSTEPELILEFEDNKCQIIEYSIGSYGLISVINLPFPRILNTGKIMAKHYAIAIKCSSSLIINKVISPSPYKWEYFQHISSLDNNVEVIQNFDIPLFPGVSKYFYRDQGERCYININMGNEEIKKLLGEQHTIEYRIYVESCKARLYKMLLDLTNYKSLTELETDGLYRPYNSDIHINAKHYNDQNIRIDASKIIRIERPD